MSVLPTLPRSVLTPSDLKVLTIEYKETIDNIFWVLTPSDLKVLTIECAEAEDLIRRVLTPSDLKVLTIVTRKLNRVESLGLNTLRSKGPYDFRR